MVEILCVVFAEIALGREDRVLAVGDFCCGENVVTELDDLRVSG